MSSIMREDWIECGLGEIGIITSGGTPSTTNDEFWGGEISWITPVDLSKYSEKFISKGRKSITELGLQKSSARLIPKHSVLFSSRAPIGYTVIAANELCTNQGFKNVTLYNGIDFNFVYYFLKSSKQLAELRASGTTFKELSGKSFSELPFSLAPLPIQRAIVSKIEALFSDLDNGIANFKKAQEQLKIYRQAVLKKAFEGELSEPLIKNDLSDVCDLKSQQKKSNQSINQKNHSSDNLPNGWKWVKISEIAKINPVLPDKVNIDKNLEVQFLPMKLVEAIVNKVHLIETRSFEDVLKGSYTPFIDEDIIFAKVTPCMENGKIAIVSDLKNGIGFGSSEFHVLRSSEKINNKYLYNFIVQDSFRNKAQHAMTGAVGLRRVPKQFIESYLIPLPPTLQEQTQIIQEIESRLSVCDKVEQSITESIEKAEALRQSILKKAFDGKLLSKAEIELCKKETDYEPASELLKKIQAEKLAKEQEKKKPKKNAK
jgi:type I restriction enzyme, S subunit